MLCSTLTASFHGAVRSLTPDGHAFPSHGTRFFSAACHSRSTCRPVRVVRCSSTSKHQLKFRQANAQDMSSIRKMVIKERMNPLGLPVERFIVAESENKLVGFGQLQQQPNQQDVQFLELRTLIVDDALRGQGIGSAVMEHLLDTSAASHTDVYLTTLKKTIPFYQKVGFQEVPRGQVPRAMWFEVLAGSIVAPLAAGDSLVVLKRSAPEPTTNAAAASKKTLL